MKAQHYFFHRAFRPFFFGALLFSITSMFFWWLQWSVPGITFQFSGVSPVYWHAHEMVYGYALATVTGFLLTAVMNWTGLNTASGKLLILLFVLWGLARVGYLLDWPIVWIALLDISFTLGLFLHFTIPVIQDKQWKQMGLASKFFLLLIANLVFYLGAFGLIESGMRLGIILGLFLVLAINLTMMRRLIPFFTEKSLGLPEKENTQWIDVTAIVGFLALMIAASWFSSHWVTTLIAVPLFMVHLIRVRKWYHRKIWRFPLLWPLHVSYLFMVSGIGLYGLVGLNLMHESIAIHALAAGGIGLLCSAILARIALGHTNRNVFEPPRFLTLVFALLLFGALVRVVMPVMLPEYYSVWIQFSQWGWIFAFALLSVLYWKVLLYPSPKPTTGILL